MADHQGRTDLSAAVVVAPDEIRPSSFSSTAAAIRISAPNFSGVIFSAIRGSSGDERDSSLRACAGYDGCWRPGRSRRHRHRALAMPFRPTPVSCGIAERSLFCSIKSSLMRDFRVRSPLPAARPAADLSQPCARPGGPVARHPQPRGQKPALWREIPSILRGFQGRLSC